MKLNLTALVGATTLLLATFSCFGESLTFVSSIPLSAPLLSSARASYDGKLVILHLREAGSRPPGIQVIDTSDIQRPKAKGFIPLPDYGFMPLPNYEDVELSSDGTFALLVFAKEQEKFRKETAHEIIALDLTDASKPRELWRKLLYARQVRISADAGAYAYSKLSADKKTWETTVVFVSQNREPLVVNEGEYNFGDLLLSAHAKFLAYNDHADLRVRDLTSNPPKLYEHEFIGRQRYGCLAGVLENGYVVVNDYRFTQLGLYETSPGMPRTSILAYEGIEYCDPINPATLDNRLYYQIGRSIDYQNPKAPTMGNILKASEQIHPIAVAGVFLYAYYATSINNPELRIYRISKAAPTTTVWQILDSKYSAIMDSYNADLKSRKTSPHIDAVKRFEEAGVLAALDEPVVDIPLQRAAAILNDYGFLAGKKNANFSLIEHIYRRVIELDPTRKVAYLNLADLLKNDLANESGVSKRKLLSAEIKKYYRAYLRLGGKQTANISEFLKNDPALQMINDACVGIVAYAKAGQLDELAATMAPNVLVDGKRVDLIIVQDDDGTAMILGFDSATDFPVKYEELPSLPPGVDDQVLASQLSLLTFGDETYFLYHKGLAHPISSIALSSGHTCTF